MDTDRAWEVWGSREPYYSVITDDQYLADKIDDAKREVFFRTGAAHITRLLKTYIRLRVDGARFTTALDFGCGVGRLVIPLSASFASVTGVDVSQSMLDETRRNCKLAGAENISLMQTSRFLEQEKTRSYDLVHSVLVFQHIRRRRGEFLLAELLSRLAPGGVASIQLIYAERNIRNLVTGLMNRIPLAHKRAQWRQGKTFVAPMEMNHYDLSSVLAIFHDHGLTKLQTSLSWMDDRRSITIVGVAGAA
jgi:cyclopropane fatty-acyl-phospholipid synthase-like methyltransferase